MYSTTLLVFFSLVFGGSCAADAYELCLSGSNGIWLHHLPGRFAMATNRTRRARLIRACSLSPRRKRHAPRLPFLIPLLWFFLLRPALLLSFRLFAFGRNAGKMAASE